MPSIESTAMLTHRPLPYPVVELRRDAIVPGGRAHFARYLETWCLDEADEGASIALGQFFERDDADRFAWLRGYRDIDARAQARQAGVARAREAVLERYIVASAALLLRPLHADAAIPALAPVDPLAEPAGAQGIAVAQLLPVAPGLRHACTAAADPWFASYCGHGVIEAGILATLDDAGAADTAHLVWLGMLRDEHALGQLRPRFDACAAALAAAGLLAGQAELVVLAPAPRSRLRWGPRTLA